MSHPYGNTISAYRQRHTLYGASGGIHFGVDLTAPCGTEIVAIADGLVFAVDGPFGSPPHNLMIDHPRLGYASMYGHLLEAPPLTPGQFVKQGEVIALVGSSSQDCKRGAHLHLEIRDLKHSRKFNPLNLIEADWDKLVLYGSSGRGFMRDLAEPRQWQTLYKQPEVQTGGPIVNDFERTWPMDWSQPEADIEATPRPTATAAVETGRLNPTPTATPLPPIEATGPTTAPATTPLPVVRQITTGDCCTNPFWSPDSTEVYFIDRPSAAEPVGVWGVDVTQLDASPRLVLERLGVYNADRSLVVYPDRQQGLVIVERLADGQRWELDSQGSSVSFTPGGRLLWTVYDSEVSWRARKGEIWLANADGSNAELVATLDRGGPVAWLSDKELLVASRMPSGQDTLLSTLSIEDGTSTELIQLPRMRGMVFSADRRYMVYMVRFNVNSENDGLWLLDLQASKLEPERLPFFGAYRWRDNENLIYIPFDLEAAEFVFYEYNVRLGKTGPLFPNGEPVLVPTIANNDWHVSPDGSKIALVTTAGDELDGIWVIELDRTNKKIGGR
jgi:hypothetical protein